MIWHFPSSSSPLSPARAGAAAVDIELAILSTGPWGPVTEGTSQSLRCPLVRMALWLYLHSWTEDGPPVDPDLCPGSQSLGGSAAELWCAVPRELFEGGGPSPGERCELLSMKHVVSSERDDQR